MIKQRQIWRPASWKTPAKRHRGLPSKLRACWALFQWQGEMKFRHAGREVKRPDDKPAGIDHVRMLSRDLVAERFALAEGSSEVRELNGAAYVTRTRDPVITKVVTYTPGVPQIFFLLPKNLR